jgi:tetratricopeptide (TPR) repeat protein
MGAALDHLWEAGVEAVGTSAAASLNLIFDRAFALTEQMGEVAAQRYVDFVIMVFPSMLILGEFDKMRAHLPRATELARRHGRPNKVSACQSHSGMLCWFEGRYAEGVRETEEGMATGHALNSPALIFANQIMLANLLHGQGEIARALIELEDLRDTVAAQAPSYRWRSPAEPGAMAISFTGWILMETGRYAEALEFGEQGLEIATRLRDPYAELLARNAIGRILLRLRRNEEAAACLRLAAGIAETHGYDAPRLNLVGHLASALARLGRGEEAIERCEAILAANLHRRTGQMEAHFLKAGYGEALFRAGRRGAGLAALDEARAIAAAIDNPCLTASALATRAALLGPGDAQAAKDRAAAAALCRRHDLAYWEPE